MGTWRLGIDRLVCRGSLEDGWSSRNVEWIWQNANWSRASSRAGGQPCSILSGVRVDIPVSTPVVIEVPVGRAANVRRDVGPALGDVPTNGHGATRLASTFSCGVNSAGEGHSQGESEDEAHVSAALQCGNDRTPWIVSVRPNVRANRPAEASAVASPVERGVSPHRRRRRESRSHER